MIRCALPGHRGGVAACVLRAAAFLACCLTLVSPCAFAQATNPSPANASSGININSALSWTASPGATTYKLSFGTSNPPLYQAQTTQTLFRLETLARGTTYYWRVDPFIGASGTSGTLWSFSTSGSGTDRELYKWPINITMSMIDRNPTYNTINSGDTWNYEKGLLLGEMFRLAKILKTSADTNLQSTATTWVNYIQTWGNVSVNSSGVVSGYTASAHELDDIGPAKLLIWLDEWNGGGTKYALGADTMKNHLATTSKTTDGGYWHKTVYKNQMWLDGLYMAGPFSVLYAKFRNQPAHYDAAVAQLKLVAHHTSDTATGLYHHGWQELNRPGVTNQAWADATGRSPEVWGRALGWYGMALVDELDTLPTTHTERAAIITLLQNYCAALLPYQDAKTGMWFQIVDKGNLSDNWVESSGTAMFGYTMAKGVIQGHLNASYMDVARRAFRGLLNTKVTLSGAHTVDLYGTVQVGSLNTSGNPDAGTYVDYIGVATRLNDNKGVGAFIGLATLLSQQAALTPVELSGFNAE